MGLNTKSNILVSMFAVLIISTVVLFSSCKNDGDPEGPQPGGSGSSPCNISGTVTGMGTGSITFTIEPPTPAQSITQGDGAFTGSAAVADGTTFIITVVSNTDGNTCLFGNSTSVSSGTMACGTNNTGHTITCVP